MRPLPATLLLSTLLMTAAPAVLAQATPEPSGQMPQVIVRPDKSQPVAPKFLELIKPSESRLFVGEYSLTNGETLKVERIGKQFFAQNGSIGRLEIFPVAPYITFKIRTPLLHGLFGKT